MARVAVGDPAHARVDRVRKDPTDEGAGDPEISGEPREVVFTGQRAFIDGPSRGGLGPPVRPHGSSVLGPVVHGEGEAFGTRYMAPGAPVDLLSPHRPLADPLALIGRDLGLEHHQQSIAAEVLGSLARVQDRRGIAEASEDRVVAGILGAHEPIEVGDHDARDLGALDGEQHVQEAWIVHHARAGNAGELQLAHDLQIVIGGDPRDRHPLRLESGPVLSRLPGRRNPDDRDRLRHLLLPVRRDFSRVGRSPRGRGVGARDAVHIARSPARATPRGRQRRRREPKHSSSS